MKKLIFIFSLILLTLLPVSSIANPDTLSLEGKPISDITIEGLKRTKEYIVQRELISRVSDNYHAANIKQEMQNLELLDIFSSIKIVPTVENDSVNIKYVFVETFPVLPSISIKITDVNGISAGGGVK
ncbi:MAG: POTRA domain-containing protein, partial [Calditrichia bacterium]